MMSVRTELEKMLAGEPYQASDTELTSLRTRARRLLRDYNATDPAETDLRVTLLETLLAEHGDGVWIEPPFFCDYGGHIHLGSNIYINFNCVILDCNVVRIGDGSMLGPSVQISAATHPVDPAARATGAEMAYPVEIGQNVWIGAAAIIGPGVTIGDDTTIGAGSVVTKDVPAGVVAAGNPARVIRHVDGDRNS